MKEDERAIAGSFSVDTSAAGPTMPDSWDSTLISAASGGVEVWVTNDADGSDVSVCALEWFDKVDDCGYGPLDDMKFKYLCEMGGSYEYGIQGYDCEAHSYPSSLFCVNPNVNLFLQ